MKRYTPYFQEVPGIYVYSLTTVHNEPYRTDKVTFIYYESLDSFIHSCKYRNIELFGYSIYDRLCYRSSSIGVRPKRCKTPNCQEHDHYTLTAEVVCDENGLLITPDVIRSAYYDWMVNRPPRYYRPWKRGWWRSRHRCPKTTNERRQYDACMLDEDAPNVRGERRPSNLPNTWDDRARHNDNCWKTQSKRKHQWKPK